MHALRQRETVPPAGPGVTPEQGWGIVAAGYLHGALLGAPAVDAVEPVLDAAGQPTAALRVYILGQAWVLAFEPDDAP